MVDKYSAQKERSDFVRLIDLIFYTGQTKNNEHYSWRKLYFTYPTQDYIEGENYFY